MAYLTGVLRPQGNSSLGEGKRRYLIVVFEGFRHLWALGKYFPIRGFLPRKEYM